MDVANHITQDRPPEGKLKKIKKEGITSRKIWWEKFRKGG
jgi:hypothetical protein